MIDWIEIPDSDRVDRIAYDAATERIFVRFRKDGVYWQYEGCPLMVWQEFCAPGTSKGKFIHRQLNHHRHGPMVD